MIPDDHHLEVIRSVREKGWKQRRQLWIVALSTAFLILVANFGNAIYTKSVADGNTRQQIAIQEQQVTIQCAAAYQSQVTQKSLALFARRFGAAAPVVPHLPRECEGQPKDPVYVGSSGNNRIVGTRHKDFMNGEAGNDSLHARGGGDTLIGGKGNDYEVGANGSDSIYGSGGSDTLRAGGDGRVDHLNGGHGRDTCYIRAADVAVACERIIHI